MRKRDGWVWGLVLAIGGVACGEAETPAAVEAAPPVAVMAESPAAEAPPDPMAVEEEADAALGAKVGPVVRECLNRFGEPVFRARDRYFEWVDEETGPTGRERHVRGTGELFGGPDACIRAIEESRAAEPAQPTLDAASEAYGAALREVFAKVNDANTYYDRENYKDDDFAGGLERHAPLVAAFGAFTAASDALGNEVRTLNEGLTERRLARLARDPERELELLSERVMVLSRQLLESTDGWTVERGKLVGIEVEPFVARVTELEGLADQLAAKQAEGIDTRVARTSHIFFGTFVREVGELVTAAKATMRRARDQEAFSRGELMQLGNASAQHVTGAPPSMTREFNDMVGALNRVRWIQG